MASRTRYGMGGAPASAKPVVSGESAAVHVAVPPCRCKARLANDLVFDYNQCFAGRVSPFGGRYGGCNESAFQGESMARKTRSLRELREEADAVERIEAEQKATAPKAVKKTVKRKSRSKVAKEVRLKAFWGVFNQSLRRVSVFEYNKRAEAERKAEELSGSQKTPHFVQLVKEVIEE